MVRGRIDTESVASSMENKMSNDPIISPKACIFKIPSILYRHNEKAYNPNAFSIGPFHHGKVNLQKMEKMKFRYLEGLLTRTGNRKTMLRQCISEIKTIEKEARECYAEEIDVSENEFVEMLVLDGCFIIELFRRKAGEIPEDEGDPIFSRSCMLQFLYQDLILLENQIPWFVLECLFSLTSGPFESKSLVQVALEFFHTIFSPDEPIHKDLSLFAIEDIKHILDLLRSSLLLPLPEERPHRVWQAFPSATVIKESGIKFKKVNSTTILNIRFVNDTLEMPSFYIHEITEPLFRNLISYEQCYSNCSPRFTCYAILLDNLVNTREDMTTLCNNRILKNWLYPEDAMQIFKALYHDTLLTEFYYMELCQQVNEYGKKLWPRWRAFYYHNYFGKPWAIVSQIVATILLTLTILQTIYTMMPGK